MDFLEFWRDSRVTMSNSGFHLYWPREVQSSFDLRGRAGDCSLVTAVQNRPHLGLFPGPRFPLQVRQDLGVPFQTHTGSQASSRGEAEDSALPSSPNRYLLEPTERPKGNQASCGVWREDSVLLSMPGRKVVPYLVMTGASRGFSRAVAPEWGF